MNYITFKKMFDYVEKIEKARPVKYIKRFPKKNGKGYDYIYKETFKKPFKALLDIFKVTKERILDVYEKQKIQKTYGVDQTLFSSHVLEYFVNKEKWDAIFTKKANREKYKTPVKQENLKTKEKKETSQKEKKETVEKTNANKVNRSLMRTIWSAFNPKAKELEKQDNSVVKENLTTGNTENLNDEDKQQLEDFKFIAWKNRAGSYEYTDKNGNVIKGETGLSGGMMKGKYSDEVAELAKMSKEELEAEEKRLQGIVYDNYGRFTRQAASRSGSLVNAMVDAETRLKNVKQVLRRFRKGTQDKQPAGKEGVTKESGNEYIYSKKKFSDFIDNFVANGYKSDKSVNLLDSTPSILKEHGFPDNPISITPNIMKKILVDESKAYHGHNLPVEILKDLPNQLEEPVYILKGKDNKKVIVTEHNIENNPVIAILELNRNEGRIIVNSVRSLYDKNSNVFAEWINNPNIVEYEDKEKSKALLQSIGLQSPKEVTTPDNENISESNSDVNGEHGNKEAMKGNQNAKKLSKKDTLIEFIKKQTNIDLSKYVDDKYSKRTYLNVDWKKIPKDEQNLIRRLASANGGQRFSLSDNGGLGMALVYGSKLQEQDKESVTDGSNSVEQIKNALKEDFKNKAIEKPQIEYSRENYDKLFPRGNIKTPIGHVKLGENQYEKLKAKSREDLLGVVAETLKNPLVIINENGSHIYAKSFLESGKTKSYQSVVVKIDGQDISISTHQRDTNNILNKIKKAEDVIYTNDSQQLPGSRNASVAGTTRETGSPQLPGTWNKPEMAGTTRETKLPHFDSQDVNPNEVSDNSEEMSSTEHGNKTAMLGNQNAFKGHLSNKEKVKIVSELKGEPYEEWNTDVNKFAVYYNRETGKETGIAMTKDIADIIDSHNEPSVLDWQDNIAEDIHGKYPKIDKQYIREAIRAIRMGVQNGKKQNIKIIGEQSAESSVNEVKPQTDSEMKKEQENTKKARKEAGLPDIGKNYGERVSALEDAYSLNPNAENYAYKDTGYIAGSQREKVQITLKRKAEAGETVNIGDVDWNALEENSRTAAQLITKDNIIGKIDYQKMKDKGIDSKAAAMITSIYRSIGKEPVDNTPEGRKNFVWAISTLRERLESCKTYKEVFAMIKEIGEERSGKYTTLLSMDSEYGELETQYNNIINSQKEINNKIINNYNLNLNRKFKNKEERTEYWQNFLKKEYPGLDEFKISYGYYSSPYEKLPYISIEETKINELREKKKAAFKGAVERIELANPMLKAWKQLGDKCLDDYGRPAKSIFDYYNAFKNLEIWKGSTAFTSQKDSNYAKYLNWGWEEKDKTKKEQSSIVKGRVKQKFEMIVPDKYERIGGRNVSVDSSQALKKAYNFREVQVGTWVQTDVASAKWHTDNINEGFADLCDITGIPDNLVSMNGRIAIAIGARGVKGAKAHYEPGERVIQINKMQGGGALGHEWFHAFDNLISEAINGGDYNEWFTWQGKEQIKMASSHGNNKSSVKQVVSNNNDSLNQKVRDKFTNLVHAMMEGDTPETNTVEFDEEKWNKCQSFYNLKTKIAKYKPRTLNAAQTFKDAKKIIDEYYDDRIAREKDYQSRGYTSGMSVEKLTQEKIKSLEFAAIKFADKEKGETEYLTGRVVSRYYQDAKKLGNGYWDTPHEMAARAFQCWLNDKLKEQGRKNTYLVGMVDNDKYGGVFYPYPTERDRIKINKAFDELFKVIKSENAIRKALLFEESAHPRGNGGQFTKKFAADKGANFGGSERTYNKKKFADLTDEEKQQKKKQIRSNIVSKVKIGIIHKTEDKRASDVAYEWVDENIKGDIFTVIGNVKFNRKTVKEDLSHGFGQEKLDTLTAVKDVLEKGTYLGYERNFQGETNENHYFAGKIKYGNDEKIVFCRVKDSAGGNSCFYVHEVFTEDEIKSDLPRLGVREADSSRLVGKPLYKFILQTIFNVNDDNIIRKAIFLSKLNHEFCKLVEREKRKEAYLDKLGRGYIAYLKKHHPELV